MDLAWRGDQVRVVCEQVTVVCHAARSRAAAASIVVLVLFEGRLGGLHA